MTEEKYLRAQLKLLSAEFEFLLEESKRIQGTECDSGYAKLVELCSIALSVRTVSCKINFIHYELEKLKERRMEYEIARI